MQKYNPPQEQPNMGFVRPKLGFDGDTLLDDDRSADV